MPNKIWSWKRTGTGGWWTKTLSATPAGIDVTPYYHIPDKLKELGKRYIENGEYRDGDDFVDGIMAIIDDA